MKCPECNGSEFTREEGCPDCGHGHLDSHELMFLTGEDE